MTLTSKQANELIEMNAIKFGKWIWSTPYAPSVYENKWQNQEPGKNEIITTEELYQLYIKQSQ